MLGLLLTVSGCVNSDPKTILASAAATKDVSGEITFRDAAKTEAISLQSLHGSIVESYIWIVDSSSMNNSTLKNWGLALLAQI